MTHEFLADIIETWEGGWIDDFEGPPQEVTDESHREDFRRAFPGWDYILWRSERADDVIVDFYRGSEHYYIYIDAREEPTYYLLGAPDTTAWEEIVVGKN